MNVPKRLALSAVGLVLGCALAIPSAFPQAAKPQAHETNLDGVTAEIAEATRKEGVLTIKMRLRNSGAAPVRVVLTEAWEDVDKIYAVSGNTKLLVLKDAKKVPLMVALNNFGALRPEIKPNGSYLFWAKYPAPPADVKKVSFFIPIGPPIEDIPITDSK